MIRGRGVRGRGGYFGHLKEAKARFSRMSMLASLALRDQTAEGLMKVEPVRSKPKAGRNAPCPCGSGRKSKRCCS